MPHKLSTTLFVSLIISSLLLLFSYTHLLSSPLNQSPPPSPQCNLFRGKWRFDSNHKPIYGSDCPFHRNSWNCIRNKRTHMGRINSWKWVPDECELRRVDPVGFLGLMRDKRIGFVGDSLNENFVVGLLCLMWRGDPGGRKWKRKGAWRGGYFPGFNVTVGYHRAVLLAKYEFQSKQSDQDGLKGINRVDVDIPVDDWADITEFYDVLIFNTGHWWNLDKFPKETPLVFYEGGHPTTPPLGMLDGLRVVLANMVSQIENKVPRNTLKFWRLQSPRHFFGGDWNQNGSCLFDNPLAEEQLDLWFDPSNNGVNKEARQINNLIQEAIRGTTIQLLDLTHLSEYRADAHPAIWLGKQDAVAIWGQDCMHWCLPGVPDTWVDILSELIRRHFVGG